MRKIKISRFMKILLTLIFLLLLETVIIFMLIEKKRTNNMDRYMPGYNPEIPVTVVINIPIKNTSADST